jgi:hypothetical protein
MSEPLTREQAIAFHDSKAYETMSLRDRAIFQINQPLLCMPFDVFHEAIEKSLGRPVFTHEFVNADALRKELMGEQPAPTLAEILSMIPTDKLILIGLAESASNENGQRGSEANG